MGGVRRIKRRVEIRQDIQKLRLIDSRLRRLLLMLFETSLRIIHVVKKLEEFWLGKHLIGLVILIRIRLHGWV
jgi:hypothetical protein